MNFYLDDYNLIRVKESQKLLNKCLKVFCNSSNIDYSLIDDGDYLSLHLNYEYTDKDDLYVMLDDVRYEITPRFITLTDKFDDEYKTEVDKLGCFLDGNTTSFRLWAPLTKKAFVVINGEECEMSYDGKGIYTYTINSNLDGFLYHYKLIRDTVVEFSDPFSYVDKDGDSYILDPLKFNKDIVKPTIDKKTIIYETSVRDFSSQDGLAFVNKKKIVALAEENLKLDGQKIGLDYLVDLGISHIQLMPIFSYENDGYEYNWGYNPISFNTIHNDYLISDNPYEKINEVRTTFNKLHEKNIKVNLDVVFNHVYKPQLTSLDKMMPYYFFRYQEGKLGNATYCGNETRSEVSFYRDYIKLMCKRYIELFDIDGLRFDLMGVMDFETINDIYLMANSIKPGFMVYGEGWNMGEVLSKDRRATIENSDKMKNISFFNGYFRDNLRGRDIYDKKCFLFGDGLNKDDTFKVLNGSYDYGLDKNQSINYVECHDNYTMFDKAVSLNEQFCKEICKLSIALTVLSIGIPFIHSGQEFLRTKNKIDNTFNMPDTINKLDWYRKNDNLDVVSFLKDMIKIRNNYNEFSDDRVVVGFENYYECLIFKLNALNIFINPCGYDHIYNSLDDYQVFYDENGFVDYTDKAFKIPAFSILLAYKKQ